MQFTSLAFAIFLPIVFLIYWAVPNKYRAFFIFLVAAGLLRRAVLQQQKFDSRRYDSGGSARLF